MTEKGERETPIKRKSGRVMDNDEILKDTPALLCTRTLAFSYPSNFHPQELHDKDVKKRLALSVLAVAALLVTSPIATNQH